MDNPFIRTRYYSGKLLHASDFIKDQEYNNSKLEFINRKFQGCGIIEGLDVQTLHDGRLKVTAGSAIDPQGRIIIAAEDKELSEADIEGLEGKSDSDFILGISYAEEPAETERTFLNKEESYQTARLKETFALKAYSAEEWQKFWTLQENKKEEALVQEKVLYEDGGIRLAVRLPKLVPGDSIFRLRIQVQTVDGSSANVGWKGVAKLQGAFFANSGNAFCTLEKEWTTFSGSLQQEYEICTEEGRKLPVMIEINRLEVNIGGFGAKELETCQFYIETASQYHAAVRDYLWKEKSEQRQMADWIPLAHVKAGKGFSLLTGKDVRFSVMFPREEEVFRRIEEENGIADIRWRAMLKHLHPGIAPFKPPLPAPSPHTPLPPKPPETPAEPEVPAVTVADCVKQIKRGVAVITVPKHYKRGQVLKSEEIFHGFPGEDVFILYGQMIKMPDYEYWEHKKEQYFLTYGNNELFQKKEKKDWNVEKQALRQDLEKGTFEIAITLFKGRRRNKIKEVAISWVAFKTV